MYKLWQSPIGKQAVPHWTSILRWIWSISECNLKTRDSWEQTPRRVTCYSGNVEGADLKYIAKGQPILTRRWELEEATWPFLPTWREGREKPGTCLQCVWQRSTRSIETQMVSQSNPFDFISWYNPSQAFTVKHVSCPWLTATQTSA